MRMQNQRAERWEGIKRIWRERKRGRCELASELVEQRNLTRATMNQTTKEISKCSDSSGCDERQSEGLLKVT